MLLMEPYKDGSRLADLVENELGQRNTMDSKLQVLGEKKRLMDQILSVLNEPAVEQNGTHALDAFKVVEDPGSEPIGEKPQNVKSVLEKKYNELLATKKRIAEIRSMMTTLEANCGDISNETDEIPGPSRSAKINNMLQQASKNLPEQRFDPLEERKNLSQLKRQLLALDDDQLGKITDGNVLAGCQMPSNDLEEIEETHFPNGRQMNSIKNNLTDFLPCRISKPVRVQQNVKVAPKQQNIEVEDATECDDCEEDDDEEEENSLNVNQQKSDKNRASIRNNVIHSPLNNRRRIIENSRNEHISRRMNSNNVWNGVAQHQTNVENLQGPLSSSSDSRYDQLSQHIESIRLIFDSLINNQQQHQPQQQQAHQFMASSFPPPARQNNCGANENFMSQSLISMGVATNAIPQMQYQQQNQELMLSLIKCQQQLFAEHCELQRLNEMYKELSNKVNNENSLGQNAIDSRPLSTSSLYNLLAPNPYLHDSYKQQQSILTQRLPFYPRSTNQSFNSRQSRNEENSFPKRSSSTKLRRSSYLNERSNQSSFLNGRNAALKNRVFSPAVGHHSNNDARINDNSRNNLDFEDGPFDSLRESIYSEVATLISQNEQRPHYLLELFKELQLLSSDQLRERAFSAIHDILDRYLMDENDNSTGGIWNRANGPQSNVKISKSKSLKVKSIADSEKTYADERDRDATDNVSTEPEIVDNLNDISPDLNLENDEITFCPEMETRLSKIEHELSLFLSQASTTNIKCDEKFQEFLRKFALALLVSYNFLPSRDPTTKFFRKKLSESLQECLARFVNVKLSDYRQEILTSLIDTMKNQLSFYFLVQNVDSALDDSIKEKIENRKNERPDIKRIFLADPKIIPKQAPSKANFVEHNVRSPSEFSEILQYREEFQTVDDALAYIDDEFKALDNEEQASIRSRVESRNSAEVEKCIATTSKN
uniref:Pericentriolar material 1 protein C-terminal domain-containing protein n=1 Tax=Romanomermis culicivorax TaxID=13658 RepID=A0A915HW07_ROMCU